MSAQASTPTKAKPSRFDSLVREWLSRHDPESARWRRPQIEEFRSWCLGGDLDPLEIDRARLHAFRDERGRNLATIDAFLWFVEQHGVERPGDFTHPLRYRGEAA